MRRKQHAKVCDPVVYIWRTDRPNFFKIGKTINNHARQKTGHTFNPDLTTFDIIKAETENDAFKCEKYLKDKLQSRRYAGEIFVVEQAELESLIKEAREFFLKDYLPKKKLVDRLCEEKSTDAMLPAGPEAQSLYLELISIRAQHFEIDMRRKYLENRLRLLIGTAAGIEQIATWKTEEKTRFDQDRFEADYPELYKEYYTQKTYERKLLLPPSFSKYRWPSS